MAVRSLSLFVLLFGFAAWAAEDTGVQALGQSAIYGGDKINARDKALEDAMRKAVEQAVGAMVSSTTVTENFQLISDKILSKSKGYVRSYKILSEGEEAGVYQVRIDARVASGNLQSDLDGILAVLKAKNMPRTLLLISEQNVGSAQGNGWWSGSGSYSIDLGVVENSFIDAWSPKGFSFVDRQALQGKIQAGQALKTAGVPDAGDVRTFASDSGAEIVVWGQAIATDAGPVQGTQMHSVRADVSLRALSLDSGRILATATVSKAAAHLSPASGGTQALKAVAQAAADELLQKILATWETEVAGPSTISLVISGVQKSKHLRSLATVLRNEVRGVQDVRERSYKKKVAELEVSFKGSGQDLAEQLEEKHFADFQLEVDEFTGNTVKAVMKGR